MAEEKSTLNEELQSTGEEVVEEVFDEAVSEETTATSQEDELKVALDKIASLEGQLEEAENRYLRLKADYENSRRRARLDLEATQKYRSQSLITDILPALDNFDRALQMESDNEQVKSLLQGMQMVYRSLHEALLKEGLEPIEAVGNEFDPNLHQAVMQVEDENFGSNVVVEEFQKGYKLKDRVLRPSMVKVNQ
ncbi:nucleotide exchange factor GrpE [Cytobacillus sp. FJAT-54145]|uniref:Protein GrpE n=1 Tax=Cytobacillus spartinae TaxID=3299023 RepID=A0ABW6KK23_9BACI